MKNQRFINLPALGKKVPLGAYVKAIKAAKDNPTLEFKTGLSCWWPCTGSEIQSQFMTGVMDRINKGIPYNQRGIA